MLFLLLLLPMLRDTRGNTCDGVRIFIHDLPRFDPKYNHTNGWPHIPCSVVKRGFQADASSCDGYTNNYLGERQNTTTYERSMIWNTWMNSFGPIWYERIAQECRARTSETADFFLVPYPAAEFFMGHRWGNRQVMTMPRIIEYYQKVREYLLSTPEWRRCGGCDHILIIGRNSPDFYPPRDTSDFNFFHLGDPFWFNVTQVTSEVPLKYHPRIGNTHTYGVPYTSFLHVDTPEEAIAWAAYAEAHTRKYVTTLIAGRRPWRTRLFAACEASPDTCHLVECKHGCHDCCTYQQVAPTYLSSHFCLMPLGDQPTRRAYFDALQAACIPVLQASEPYERNYEWFTPTRHLKQIAITPDAFGHNCSLATNITCTLQRLNEMPGGAITQMRRRIINIIPSLGYARAGGHDAIQTFFHYLKKVRASDKNPPSPYRLNQTTATTRPKAKRRE